MGQGKAQDTWLADLQKVRQSAPTTGDTPPPPDAAAAQTDAPEEGSVLKGIAQALGDVGTGAAKGAGETFVDLGNLVHSIPGVGAVTDALAKATGPAGTDPSTAFRGAKAGLQPTNSAQSVGHGLERAAEFLGGGEIAGGGLKAAARVPYAVQPFLSNLVTPSRIVKMLAQVVGEGGSAAGLTALHGGNPDTPAGIAAAGPVAGEAVAAMAPLVEKPLIQQLAAVMGGASVGNMFGGLTGAGMGGVLAMQPAVRAMVRNVMRNPQAMTTIQTLARQGIPMASRLFAMIQAEMQSGMTDTSAPEAP